MDLEQRLQQIKCFLFDMDGTVYLGNKVLPGAAGVFAQLKKLGKSYYFLTNNSSRDQDYYQEKLDGMGIDAHREQILISSHSLAHYLSEKPVKRVFVLGTRELKEYLAYSGYKILEKNTQVPDYVVVGFDTGLDYEKLTIACQHIDSGVPYVATHPDVRCPLEGGLYIPDCGSLLALIKTATGKECEFVAGKPSRQMLDVVTKKTGVPFSQLAMVGDRLNTDIALGNNNGILSILLLKGEATLEDLKTSVIKPDIVLPSIEKLPELIF